MTALLVVALFLKVFSITLWYKLSSTTSHKFFVIISPALLQSSCCNFYVTFRSSCWNGFAEKLSLNRNEKINCNNCGTLITKKILAHHRKRFSNGSCFCNQCTHFGATKSQKDMKFQIAKKHSARKPDVTFKCTLCYQINAVLYALRQHENTQHGLFVRTKNMDRDYIVNELDVTNL